MKNKYYIVLFCLMSSLFVINAMEVKEKSSLTQFSLTLLADLQRAINESKNQKEYTKAVENYNSYVHSFDFADFRKHPVLWSKYREEESKHKTPWDSREYERDLADSDSDTESDEDSESEHEEDIEFLKKELENEKQKIAQARLRRELARLEKEQSTDKKEDDSQSESESEEDEGALRQELENEKLKAHEAKGEHPRKKGTPKFSVITVEIQNNSGRPVRYFVTYQNLATDRDFEEEDKHIIDVGATIFPSPLISKRGYGFPTLAVTDLQSNTAMTYRPRGNIEHLELMVIRKDDGKVGLKKILS